MDLSNYNHLVKTPIKEPKSMQHEKRMLVGLKYKVEFFRHSFRIRI